MSQLGFVGNRLNYAVLPLSTSSATNLVSAPNAILVGLWNQSLSAQTNPIAFYDAPGTTSTNYNLLLNWQPSGGQIKWFGLGETFGIDLQNGLLAVPAGALNSDGGILAIYALFNG